MLWDLCCETTQDKIGEALELTPGHLSKLLYGDQRAGTEVAVKIAKRFPHIRVALWMEAPMRDFSLPAVVQAEAAAAELAKAQKPKRGRRPRAAASA